MINKYIKIILILLFIILFITTIINIFILNMTNLLFMILNILVWILISTILFSSFITYRVILDKEVSIKLMKINLNIFTKLFNMITYLSYIFDFSKDDIRKIYIKLNNSYIYKNKYNIDNKDILVLIPHCIQKNSCKLKVTSSINNCKSCGLCNVSDLLKLNEKFGVEVFIATGGTLARKKIIEKRPKAVVAVACERDLTSGIQDIKNIPVLGVFNKRPNGPCFDTKIDIKEVEDAIIFLIGN